ncbi:MAG: hypothetical protein U0446_03125 [Dehalococcoidia bacterium]
MWGWHDGPHGWAWFWMAFMMALVWIPLILGGIWFALTAGRGGLRPAARDEPRHADVDARELARRAYARGEVDRDRFLQLMRDLEESERPRPAH